MLNFWRWCRNFNAFDGAGYISTIYLIYIAYVIDFNSPRSDNLDDLSGKSPSTGKRVVEISDLVKQRRGRAVWLRFGSGSKISLHVAGLSKRCEIDRATDSLRGVPGGSSGA